MPKLYFKPRTIEGEARERSSWRSTTQFRDRDFPARGPRQSAKQKKSREPGHLPILSTSSGRIHIRSTHFVGDGCWRGRLVVVGRKRGLRRGAASLFANRNFQPKFRVGFGKPSCPTAPPTQSSRWVVGFSNSTHRTQITFGDPHSQPPSDEITSSRPSLQNGSQEDHHPRSPGEHLPRTLRSRWYATTLARTSSRLKIEEERDHGLTKLLQQASWSSALPVSLPPSTIPSSMSPI